MINKKEARYKAVLARGRGELVRQPCEVCGTTEKVEAHHPDYTKPLEVKWLCGEHHRKHHKETRVVKGSAEKGYYKTLFVTKELHHEIKMLSVENKVSMIRMLDILIEIYKKGYSLIEKD